jgi:hypothetical protein
MPYVEHAFGTDISETLVIGYLSFTKKVLLGKGHVFRKYGYGYGLVVTFVKKGVVYERNCE